jgi:Ca2+-binding RTX toxin-like protein
LILNGGTLTVDGDLVVTQEFAPDGGVINLASGAFLDLSPGDGPAVVHGSGENDTVIGTPFDDVLHGGEGDNTLIGGLGDDTLTGGPGADRFVFRSPDEGIDTIINFSLSDDVLVINVDAFEGGLEAGQELHSSQFVAGVDPQASAAHGQFLYDTGSGALYWDVDGEGPQDRVQLAYLTDTPELTAANFELVGGGSYLASSEVAASVEIGIGDSA